MTDYNSWDAIKPKPRSEHWKPDAVGANRFPPAPAPQEPTLTKREQELNQEKKP